MKSLVLISLVVIFLLLLWIVLDDNRDCGTDAKCRAEMESPQ